MSRALLPLPVGERAGVRGGCSREARRLVPREPPLHRARQPEPHGKPRPLTPTPFDKLRAQLSPQGRGSEAR